MQLQKTRKIITKAIEIQLVLKQREDKYICSCLRMR
jgi:hypothetical protein